MRIKEIIVVEGRDDTTAIKRAVEADTIETGGSALDREKIKRIQVAQERRGVIIFTDPDYPGEKIRKQISTQVPGCKHAFLSREDARSKQGKFGVEHASPTAIQQALKKVHTEAVEQKNHDSAEMDTVTWRMIREYGLIGQPLSQKRRARIGDKLGIGYCNAKQFYKRLLSFRMTKSEFIQAYEEVEQELHADE